VGKDESEVDLQQTTRPSTPETSSPAYPGIP
jgi:hypothetical protein